MREVDFSILGREIAQQLSLWEVPSLAMGVWRGGETLFCGGFGRRDGKDLPSDGHTLFQIGSCSKAFTAALAEMLVDEGGLDLDTPVQELWPDFDLYDKYAASHVTVRDLLCHRSGLPRHEYAWYGADFTRMQLVHNLRYLEPNVELRSAYQYNNLGYVVVGALLERLTGKTWETLVSQRLLQPLGMERTKLFLEDMTADPNHALPFDRPELYAEHGWKEIPFYHTPVEDRAAGIGAPYGPAGSIISCAEDMLRWAAFQLGDGTVNGKRLLSQQRMAEMHAPQTIIGSSPSDYPGRITCCYGLGWRSCMYRGKKLLYHSGAIDGFTTALYLVPDLQLAVVANVNMTNCLLAEAAAGAVIDHYLGGQEDCFAWHRTLNREMFAQLRAYAASMRGTPVAGTTPTHTPAEFAGRYTAPGYNDLVITAADGALALDFNGFHSPLSHFHYDVFQLDGYIGELPPGLTLQFFYSPDGRVSHLEIPLVSEPGVKPIRFQKM